MCLVLSEHDTCPLTSLIRPERKITNKIGTRTHKFSLIPDNRIYTFHRVPQVSLGTIVSHVRWMPDIFPWNRENGHVV